MADYTKQQLEDALRKADAAGDTAGATEIAKTLKGMSAPREEESGVLARAAGGAVETPLSAATGMIATPVAGILGMLEAPFVGGEKAAEDIGSMQKAMTYSPRTQGGKYGVEGLGDILSIPAKAGEYVGGKVTDITGSPALGAAIDTAIQAAPMALGVRGEKGAIKIDPMREAAHESQQAGYVLPANQARPNLLNNWADSISGKIKTQQLASLKNQANTQTLIKRGLGIKDEAELNPQTLKDFRSEEGKAYDALKDPSLPRVHPGAKFYGELNDVLGDYTEAGRTFKTSAKSPIQQNVRNLAKDIRDAKGFNPSEGIAMARILRDRATAAYQAGDKALGNANKRMANALEDEIERSLPKDKPDLIKNFRQARQRIAQSYDVESAMNPVTGNVDARVMGRHLKQGTPYTGPLKTVAKQGAAFPKASQLPEQIGDYSDYSPLDYGVGVMAEAAQKAGSGNLAEAGAMGVRAPLRQALLSKTYQKTGAKALSAAELQKIAKRKAQLKGALLLQDVEAQGDNPP